MSDSRSKTALMVVLSIVLCLIVGGSIARAKLADISALQASIATASTQEDSYTRLIAQRKALQASYAQLSRKYLVHHTSVASMEASFTDLLSTVSRHDGVVVVGVNYGAINGSAPPAPAPEVDRNGQAMVAAQATPGATSDTPTDLGGDGAGNPHSNEPSIPADLFTRVPATVTLKGTWSGLARAIQDLPRQDMLVVVSVPDMKRFDATTLTLSFQAQILTPAVAVLAR